MLEASKAMPKCGACTVFNKSETWDFSLQQRSFRLSAEFKVRVRLEPAYWNVLDSIADQRGITTRQVVQEVADDVGAGMSLPSALRMYAINSLRNKTV